MAEENKSFEFEILEIRTEPNRTNRKPVVKVYKVTLKFNPEVYAQTFPCLSCSGRTATTHKFQAFKDKVFGYCPRTMVTLPVSIYGADDNSFQPYLEIVKEEPMGRNQALAYLKEKKIVPQPQLAMALMG